MGTIIGIMELRKYAMKFSRSLNWKFAELVLNRYPSEVDLNEIGTTIKKEGLSGCTGLLDLIDMGVEVPMRKAEIVWTWWKRGLVLEVRTSLEKYYWPWKKLISESCRVNSILETPCGV